MRRRDVIGAAVVATTIGIGLATASTPAAEFVLADNVVQHGSASAAESFLVVWTDASGASLDIRARVVHRNGATSAAFTIAGTVADERWPSIASDGETFLVTWTAWPGGKPGETRAARVSRDGTVLDPGGFVLARPSNPEMSVFAARVASTASGWVAFWVEDDYSAPETIHYVRGAFLARDGKPLDPPVVTARVADSRDPSVAVAGSRVLVTYQSHEHEGTTGELFSDAGERLMSFGLSSGNLSIEDVSGHGDRFLIAHKTTAVLSFEIDAASGSIREGSHRALSSKLAFGPSRRHADVEYRDGWLALREERGPLEPDVFLGGKRIFTAAWQPGFATAGDVALATAIRGNSLVGRLLDLDEPIEEAAPQSLPATPLPSPTPPTTVGAEFLLPFRGRLVTGSRDRILTTWEDHGSGAVRAQLFTPDLSPLGEPFTISADGFPNRISSDGTNFVVAWSRVTGGSGDYELSLFATRVTPDGTVVDTDGTLIDSGIGWDGPRDVSIAWVENSWLVLWHSVERHSVEAARLFGDGTVQPLGAILYNADVSSVVGHGTSAVLLVAEWGSQVRLVVVGEGDTVSPGVGIANTPAPFSFASDGADLMFLYVREYPEHDEPSGVYYETVWSVALDGATRTVREDTRARRSGYLDPYPERPSADVAHVGRWVVVREEPAATGTNIFVDDTLLFPNASDPLLVEVGGSILAFAQREHDVVARLIHFDDYVDPDPAPTPFPTESLTGPIPVPHPDDRREGSCRISGGTRSSRTDALVVVFAVLWFWHRTRRGAAALRREGRPIP